MSDKLDPLDNPLAKTLQSIEANLQATMFTLGMLLPTLRYRGDLDAELLLERIDSALSRPPGQKQSAEFVEAVNYITSILRAEVEGIEAGKNDNG